MSPIATKESVESMLIPNLAQFVSKLFIDAHERSRILDHFVEKQRMATYNIFLHAVRRGVL